MRVLYAARRILYLLINRDLKVKYSDSALGYVWTILDPMLMGVVYWFVFDVIFHRGSSIALSPYLLYLLCALMPYQWASSCLSTATRTLQGEAQLIRSVDVPREFWLIRMIASNFIQFVFAMPVIAIFAVVLHQGVHWRIVFVPVGIAMEMAALLGIGLALAPSAVLIPDIERVMRVANRILMYMCPVIYGSFAIFNSHSIPKIVKEIYAWNPFTSAFTIFRLGFFPEEHLPFTVFLRGSITCLILLAFGTHIFRKLEPEVLKEI
jgi:ABC-2 type transport system permease protein